MRTSKNKISTMWAGGVGAHGMRPDDSHNAGALADAQRAHAVRPYTPHREIRRCKETGRWSVQSVFPR